jgi:hypothetical protein
MTDEILARTVSIAGAGARGDEIPAYLATPDPGEPRAGWS